MSVATPPIGIPSVVPSAASPPVRRMTAAEFEFWPEQKGKELDDGVVVAVNVGTESSVIAGELYRRLANHVIDQRLGMAFPPETAFRCFPGHPNRARKPDVSFVAAQRLPPAPGRPLPAGPHAVTGPREPVTPLAALASPSGPGYSAGR